MRMPIFVPVLLSTLVLTASQAAANPWSVETWKKSRGTSRWEGFGVGTMTHTRSTNDVMGQKTVMEMKTTLVKITDSQLHLKVESKYGETWQTMERVEKRKDETPVEVKEVGQETLVVEGKEYPCRKLEVSYVSGAQTIRRTMWEHAKEGILKTTSTNAQGESIYTTTRLSVAHKVGDREIRCREVKLSGTAGNGRMLLSHEVPGLLVENEMSRAMGPHSSKSTTKLIALVKK